MTDTAIATALAALQAKVGQQVHLSEWMTITQERVNAFADAIKQAAQSMGGVA